MGLPLVARWPADVPGQQGNHPARLCVVVSLELGSVRVAAAENGCRGPISETAEEIEKNHDEALFQSVPTPCYPGDKALGDVGFHARRLG